MHAEIRHQGNFTFAATIRNHAFYMDTASASGGDNMGPSPKELLIAGVIGCTGMDVVSMLKKHQMQAESLEISCEAEPRKEHPRIFTAMTIVFNVRGGNITAERLVDAVQMSLTKYCGVTAMVSKVVPVHYRILLNEVEVGQGAADFGL